MIDATRSSLLVAVVAISMLISPLLLVAADRWFTPARERRKRDDVDEIDEPQEAPVIIAGFGRYGQIVGRMLWANGIQPTVLEHDADQVESLRRFGWNVFYGDATRLDLLRIAGADKARVLVLAIDDVDHSIEIAAMVRQHFPDLQVVARARNVQHHFELYELGVRAIERETFDSALMSARSTLEAVGFRPHQARTLALRFRRHNIEQLAEMAPHRGDEARFIAAAKAGRQQLESMFAQERDEAQQRARARPGWGAQPEAANDAD